MPVPLLKALNSKIENSSDQISAHVFFLPNLKSQVSDLEYIDSTLTKWDDLRNDLNLILSQAGKGTFGISIGIMEIRNVVPTLKPIDSFFSTEKSYEQGSRMMIIIVSSLEHRICSLLFKTFLISCFRDLSSSRRTGFS